MKLKWNRWTKTFWIVMCLQIVLGIILWSLPYCKEFLQAFKMLRIVATIMIVGTTSQCLVYIIHWSRVD